MNASSSVQLNVGGELIIQLPIQPAEVAIVGSEQQPFSTGSAWTTVAVASKKIVIVADHELRRQYPWCRLMS